MEAWHFLKNDKTTNYGNGEITEIGKKYTVKSKIKLCQWGLHGSINILDALMYAPGNIVTYCDFGENIIVGDDKIVSSERTVLWMVDIKKELDEFSRWCALEVIGLWDAPKSVVEFLKTGDVNKRAAASDAARAEASDAAWYAARAAARAEASFEQNNKLTEMVNLRKNDNG